MLRNMGASSAAAREIWKDPHLYIWGWQSPLHFYGRIDSPTPPFLRRQLAARPGRSRSPADPPAHRGDHGDPERQPPELIFTGYPPFRALKAFLNDRYLPSGWRRDCGSARRITGDFEHAGAPRPDAAGTELRPRARVEAGRTEARAPARIRGNIRRAPVRRTRSAGRTAPSSSTDCARSPRWSSRCPGRDLSQSARVM